MYRIFHRRSYACGASHVITFGTAPVVGGVDGVVVGRHVMFDGNSDSGDCCCSGAAILYGLPSAPRTAAAGASCCRYPGGSDGRESTRENLLTHCREVSQQIPAEILNRSNKTWIVDFVFIWRTAGKEPC